MPLAGRARRRRGPRHDRSVSRSYYGSPGLFEFSVLTDVSSVLQSARQHRVGPAAVCSRNDTSRFGNAVTGVITPPAPDSRLGRRPKVAHVVNPVTVGPESDLFVAQPVTFRSMVEARERAKTDLAVELYTVSFPEDNIPSPPAFSTLPPLKRSVLDVGRFERERKLPLIRDVLDAVIHATDADNIIYSNVDISLMPGFYRYVSAKLSDYDALVINRRTIEKAETADFQLEHFYAQPGSLHPGFDCFAFKRALYSRFSLGQACIGANWIGRIVLVNMMAYAANIWVEKEDHLTFHLGDDRSWKITANIDFDEHNASVLGRTMAKIANDGLLSKHSLLKRTYEEFTLKMRDPDPGRPKREEALQPPDSAGWCAGSTAACSRRVDATRSPAQKGRARRSS